jgi:hypothetical protein
VPRLRTGGLAALAVLAVAPAAAQAAEPEVALQQAAGTRAEAIQSAVDAYRADLGDNNGPTPTPPATPGAGRREINWDGVPAAVSSPTALPLDFFRARGALFATPGKQVEVSQNAGEGPVEFENRDPAAPGRFGTFSPQKLFTPVGSNVVDVRFVVPGTNERATTRGFGAVFTDVDRTGSTKIAYYDRRGRQIARYTVPASPGSETLSFLGATFERARVARVRIWSGNVPLGSREGGRRDVVVMDDFVYGEPSA